MGLKRKEIEILLKINEDSYTVRELSEEIGDSERNLRYSLENLEFYLKKVLNKEIAKKLKKLSVTLTREETDSFLQFIQEGNYIYSNSERKEYILNSFLFREGTKLKDIEEVLGISRTTLKKDINSLEKELENYGIFFNYEGNRIGLSGNEKKLRHLMMYKMGEYLRGNTGYPMEKMVVEIIDESWTEERKRVEDILGSIETGLAYDFSEEFKRIMVYYLWVTLHRVKRGRYILKKHNADFLRNTTQLKTVKRELRGVIPEELEYEFLHLTEYFLSGSSTREYYEERLAIELFTYDLLRRMGDVVGEDLFREKTFKEITGYLTSAIYRMKNNFILTSDREFPVNEELGEDLYRICREDNYLSEKLRDEEVYNIGEFIEKGMLSNKSKVIDLRRLMDIIRESSSKIDEDLLMERLMETYGDYIDDRGNNSMDMPDLNYYIERGRIVKTPEVSVEEVIEAGNRFFIEGKIIDGLAPIEGYAKADIFKNNRVSCYYSMSVVKKSGMNFLFYKGQGGLDGLVILLALRDDRMHLKAISQLKKMVDEGLEDHWKAGGFEREELLKIAGSFTGEK